LRFIIWRGSPKERQERSKLKKGSLNEGAQKYIEESERSNAGQKRGKAPLGDRTTTTCKREGGESFFPFRPEREVYRLVI